MKILTMLVVTLAISGCMTVNITTGEGSSAPITVQLDKPISTSTLPMRDVTIPASVIP
jgi:uncharacterized protein YceK